MFKEKQEVLSGWGRAMREVDVSRRLVGESSIKSSGSWRLSEEFRFHSKCDEKPWPEWVAFLKDHFRKDLLLCEEWISVVNMETGHGFIKQKMWKCLAYSMPIPNFVRTWEWRISWRSECFGLFVVVLVNECSCHQALPVYVLVMLSQSFSIVQSLQFSKEAVTSKDLPEASFIILALLCPVSTEDYYSKWFS